MQTHEMIEPTGLTPGYGASPDRWRPEHDCVERAHPARATPATDPAAPVDPAHALAAARLARPWPACLTIPGVTDDVIMGHAMEPSFWVQALRKSGIA